jgi:hypothetical protein
MSSFRKNYIFYAFKKFVYKNKKIILLSLLAFVILVILFRIKRKRKQWFLEGMTLSVPSVSVPSLTSSAPAVGYYDYLAPIKDSEKMKDDTFEKFFAEYVQSILSFSCPIYSPQWPLVCYTEQITASLNADKNNVRKYLVDSNISEDEYQYYLANNKQYPYNGYVIDYITKNYPDLVDKIPEMRQRGPNRIAYAEYIRDDETKMDPQPVSLQIYSGTVDPATVTPPASTTTTTTTTDSTTSSLLSNPFSSTSTNTSSTNTNSTTSSLLSNPFSTTTTTTAPATTTTDTTNPNPSVVVSSLGTTMNGILGA